MGNALFHKISEKEKKEIQENAKKIIEDFSKQLDKVKEEVKESFVEIGSGQRTEGESHENFIDREIMFENAPETRGDFIVAEVKKW